MLTNKDYIDKRVSAVLDELLALRAEVLDLKSRIPLQGVSPKA